VVDLTEKSATECRLCANGIRQSFVANFKLIVYTRKMNKCNVARKFRVLEGGGGVDKCELHAQKVFHWV
jgi:hypothetical protein